MAQRVRMRDGNILEFPDEMTREEIRAFGQKYDAEGGKSQFTQAGESASMDDPEGVSTAGLETGTFEGQKGIAREFADIPTFGFADELEAMVSPKTVDEIRAEKEQFQIQNPNLATGVNLAGAIPTMGTTAIARLGTKKFAPRFFERIENLTPAKKSMVEAGLGGFAYGVGSGEGGIDDMGDRLSQGAETGTLSAGFGGLAGKVLHKLRDIKSAKNRIINRDKTLQIYNNLVKRRYAKADLEDPITVANMQDMEKYIRSRVGVEKAGERPFDYNYIKDELPKTNRFLKSLMNRVKQAEGDGRAVTWQNLDNMRSDAWKEWSVLAKQDPTDAKHLAQAIYDLDGYMAKFFPDKSGKLAKARELWKEKKEIEILQALFDYAEEGAQKTGSGGNVVNKYLQAVDRVLGKNPDGSEKPLKRFFSPETIAEMEAFRKSNGGGRLLRSFAKLSPDGSGLMMALNLFGATVDPKTLMVTAGAKGAQYISERGVRHGAQNIMDKASRRIERRLPVPQVPTELATGMGIATGGQSAENINTGDGILNLLDLVNSVNTRR